MNLHESEKISVDGVSSSAHIYRIVVPGGWLYYDWASTGTQNHAVFSQFVPETTIQGVSKMSESVVSTRRVEFRLVQMQDGHYRVQSRLVFDDGDSGSWVTEHDADSDKDGALKLLESIRARETIKEIVG